MVTLKEARSHSRQWRRIRIKDGGESSKEEITEVLFHSHQVKEWEEEHKLFFEEKYKDRLLVVKTNDILWAQGVWDYGLSCFLYRVRGPSKKDYIYQPRFMSQPFKILKYVVEEKRVPRKDILEKFNYRVITVEEMNIFSRELDRGNSWNIERCKEALKTGTVKAYPSEKIRTLVGRNFSTNHLLRLPMIWPVGNKVYAPTERGLETYNRCIKGRS